MWGESIFSYKLSWRIECGEMTTDVERITDIMDLIQKHKFAYNETLSIIDPDGRLMTIADFYMQAIAAMSVQGNA